MLRVFSVVLAVAFLPVIASAGQAVSGAINGYLADPSGAQIANARVTITNEQTGVENQDQHERRRLL